VGDTALAASTLYCEFPKNLGFLTSIYTEMPYFKDEGKQYDPAVHNRERLYLYCAKDSLATHQIYSQQQEEMKELGVSYVYNKLIQILPLYKRMEDTGIRIDASVREELTLKYESLYDIQVLIFQTLVNSNMNPHSDLQVRKLVYEDFGYKFVRGCKRTKTGQPGVDEETLEILLWSGRAENSYRWEVEQIIKAIIAARKLHKVLEYLYSPIHPDSRARCDFNLGGAATGRTTTGKTTDSYFVFDTKTKKGGIKNVNLGRSFQNIGKHGFEVNGESLGRDLRRMFVPDTGYCFVECDLSQAEARVDAVLAKDYAILAEFDTPTGIHRLTGSWVYDCRPEEIKKNVLVNGVDRYFESKIVRHAAERNLRADGLMTLIHQPIAYCEMILKKIHSKQPNLRQVFHREVEEALRTKRCLVAPNGRRRDFYDRFDKEMVNVGISQLPQAVVTDYLKDGLHETFKNCPYAIPLNEQHDGFLAMVPPDKKEEYILEFKKNTVKPIDFSNCTLSRNYELTIPMESEWSDENWASMKEIKL
jgi:DNA polymerase-1